MAQPRKKRPHHSDEWTVAEKRKSLEMINFSARPHSRIFIPSFSELPLIGYLTPEELHPATAARVLNPSPYSNENVDPVLAAWAAANNSVCPAIRFKINGRVQDAQYVSKKPPEFAFGLLNIETISQWACIPNIQQLWLQSVWALTGCEPSEWVPHVYEKLKSRTLEPEFTPVTELTRILPSHHKIFLAIHFLNLFWRNKNYLAIGVAHLVQSKVVVQLGKNNFRNYLGEAGAKTMSDSQVMRHWAKLLNASVILEKFTRELKAKRTLTVHKFVQKNARNPFISEAFHMLDS